MARSADSGAAWAPLGGRPATWWATAVCLGLVAAVLGQGAALAPGEVAGHGPPAGTVAPADGPWAGAAVVVSRTAGADRWSATAGLSEGRPMLSVDLDAMARRQSRLPVRVSYGPAWEGFVWLSDRWELPPGTAPLEHLVEAYGTGGTGSATLSYALESPRSGLLGVCRTSVEPDPATGAFTLRLRPELRVTRDVACEGDLEFLHIRTAEAGRRDWSDGTADFAWYRWPGDGCPDAPPGGHTGVVRITDSALRAVVAAEIGAGQSLPAGGDRSRSGGPQVPLVPGASIGGYCAKAGVGSCVWLLHRYQAPRGSRLVPVFCRGRALADSHFCLSPAAGSGATEMKAGDRVAVELSLTMLPCELSREDVEDLNEADMYLFGTAAEQAAWLAGWVGTRNAVGLRHSDGSLILLGLGREPASFPVPAATVARATHAYRVFDLVAPSIDYLDLRGNTVEVWPGWITVVDCGAALWVPSVPPGSELGEPAEAGSVPAAETHPEGGRPAWQQAPAPGTFQAPLMRK